MKGISVPWQPLAGLLLSIGVSTMSNEALAAPTAEQRAVYLSAEPKAYPMGGSIPIRVRYQNRGQSSTSFREPKRSWEVKLAIHSHAAAEVSVAFGRILQNTVNGMFKWSVEDAEQVTLMPGESHEFQEDAGKRWPEQFSLGFHNLQVIDVTNDAAPLKSNVVEVRIVYDSTTFPDLLVLGSAKDARPDVVAFAAKWIAALHPEFRVTPPPGAADFTAATSWWAAHGMEPGIQRRIVRLNAEAVSPGR
jgi:hypothetical protein